MGINATQKWKMQAIDFVATVDFYHTRFQNQFFPDYDSEPNVAIIANFTDKSISNGFQAELSADIQKRLNLRFAYNFLDVYREIKQEKVLLPYNARHRFLTVASVHSPTPLWQFDLNVHWYGKQRLPNSQALATDLQQPEFSQPFTIASVQYTHTFKNFEAFVGCENVADFRQIRPILGYQNPFGKDFDTSFAWGPTKGRELYAGVRVRLGKE